MLKSVHCSLHAHKLAVLLSSDTYNDDTPIMEAAACDMHIKSQGQVHPQQPLQDQQQPQQRTGKQLFVTCCYSSQTILAAL